MPTESLKECPFCGGKITQHYDDCGGGWIEHDEKPRRGSRQKCILTGVTLNTSIRTHFEWNHRPHQEFVPLCKEKLQDFLLKYIIDNQITCVNIEPIAQAISLRFGTRPIPSTEEIEIIMFQARQMWHKIRKYFMEPSLSENEYIAQAIYKALEEANGK